MSKKKQNERLISEDPEQQPEAVSELDSDTDSDTVSDQDDEMESPKAKAARKANEVGESEGNRNIYVFGRLENEVALPVIKKLLRLNDRDAETPINMFINSSGGNGYNADGIIAIMHSIEAPVNTICLGHALSGACEILAAGTGERLAYEFSTLMFHQTLWEAEGDITNLEIQAEQGRRFRQAQIDMLHKATGKDRDTLRKHIERDFYLTAAEAFEYGIIDGIIPFRTIERDRHRDGKALAKASAKSRETVVKASKKHKKK